MNEAFQIIHLTTQDNATLMQAAFNLTIWRWPQITIFTKITKFWEFSTKLVLNRSTYGNLLTKGLLTWVYLNVIRIVWIIQNSFCIPSFIFMIEWICTNANNIHLNAASVKSPLFTKSAFETKLILPCYCQFYEFFGICVTKQSDI